VVELFYPLLTVVLFFSCSGLVRTSPTEVREFCFGCCSLTQENSLVIHYLPRFREWLITCPLSVFTPFLVFIYCEFCVLPPFSEAGSTCHQLLLSMLFTVCFCFSGFWWRPVCPGAALVHVPRRK
jgi:hypothetical protein